MSRRRLRLQRSDDNNGRFMKPSGTASYALAAVFQAAGASGAATLAPFYMKDQGFSVALVGVPLVINGLGRIGSDLLSGLLATYVNARTLLMVAASVALGFLLLGALFREWMPLFLSVWIVLGLTEAMFSLSLRKIAFDLSAPGRQGQVQGQVASSLGVGFAMGPALAGMVGARWGAGMLFVFYAVAQALALMVVVCTRGDLAGKLGRSESVSLLREGRRLLTTPSFASGCLAIFQSFLFLVGVTRVAFPFLAVSRGLTLDRIGAIVSISRLADAWGRFSGGWLCDRFGAPRVIAMGIVIGIPMYVLELYGAGLLGFMLPLSFMTMGFGFTNVASTTHALQLAGESTKALGLALARMSTSIGQMAGPLLAGLLVQELGYSGGFWSMAGISFAVLVAVSYGLRAASREVRN